MIIIQKILRIIRNKMGSRYTIQPENSKYQIGSTKSNVMHKYPDGKGMVNLDYKNRGEDLIGGNKNASPSENNNQPSNYTEKTVTYTDVKQDPNLLHQSDLLKDVDRYLDYKKDNKDFSEFMKQYKR